MTDIKEEKFNVKLDAKKWATTWIGGGEVDVTVIVGQLCSR